MLSISEILHILLHLDVYLNELVARFGLWTYFILFLIFFCESGVILTPFLPGDSLLFALGTLAARQVFHLPLLLLTLITAAILGGMLNYYIGLWLGKQFVDNSKNKLFKKYIQQTHEFYEKYGGKTILFARFFPIIRTYAPFLAGVAKMRRQQFLVYNAISGVIWILLIIGISYFLGNMPIVKQNFSLVIVFIMLVSLVPAVFEVIRTRVRR